MKQRPFETWLFGRLCVNFGGPCRQDRPEVETTYGNILNSGQVDL